MIEIFHVLEGSGKAIVDKSDVPLVLAKGATLKIDCGELHSLEAGEHESLTLLYFGIIADPPSPSQ